MVHILLLLQQFWPYCINFEKLYNALFSPCVRAPADVEIKALK